MHSHRTLKSSASIPSRAALRHVRQQTTVGPRSQSSPLVKLGSTLVLASDVTEHVAYSDYARALSELSRVARRYLLIAGAIRGGPSSSNGALRRLQSALPRERSPAGLRPSVDACALCQGTGGAAGDPFQRSGHACPAPTRTFASAFAGRPGGRSGDDSLSVLRHDAFCTQRSGGDRLLWLATAQPLGGPIRSPGAVAYMRTEVIGLYKSELRHAGRRWRIVRLSPPRACFRVDTFLNRLAR